MCRVEPSIYSERVLLYSIRLNLTRFYLLYEFRVRSNIMSTINIEAVSLDHKDVVFGKTSCMLHLQRADEKSGV
jgi:hypothetical protein